MGLRQRRGSWQKPCNPDRDTWRQLRRIDQRTDVVCLTGSRPIPRSGARQPEGSTGPATSPPSAFWGSIDNFSSLYSNRAASGTRYPGNQTGRQRCLHPIIGVLQGTWSRTSRCYSRPRRKRDRPSRAATKHRGCRAQPGWRTKVPAVLHKSAAEEAIIGKPLVRISVRIRCRACESRRPSAE
jgi:hypothetical protein